MGNRLAALYVRLSPGVARDTWVLSHPLIRPERITPSLFHYDGWRVMPAGQRNDRVQ